MFDWITDSFDKLSEAFSKIVQGALQSIIDFFVNAFSVDFDRVKKAVDFDSLFREKFSLFYSIADSYKIASSASCDASAMNISLTFPGGLGTHQVFNFEPILPYLAPIKVFLTACMWLMFCNWILSLFGVKFHVA